MTAPLGTARTAAEAHLVMDASPCECGATSFERSTSVILLGDSLGSRYSGTCSCGASREFLFSIPDQSQERADEVYFGDGKSDLLDAGEWVFIAERYAAAAPAFAPDAPQAKAAAERCIAYAVAALDQALAFFNDEGVLDHEGARSSRSRAMVSASPYALTRPRLIAIRDAYHQVRSEYDAGPLLP